jgi:hypothetical protein
MRIAEENWKVLTSLFPSGWQQMAWQSGAVARLRGFASLDVLLRMLMLHVALGIAVTPGIHTLPGVKQFGIRDQARNCEA